MRNGKGANLEYAGLFCPPMRKKVHVKDLRLGMYVAEPDRPWLETPFLFQGFHLESGADIEAVQRVCRYVYIDVERGVDVDRSETPSTTPSAQPSPAAPATGPYGVLTSVEEELDRARGIRGRAHTFIDEVFDDIRGGRSPKLAEVQAVVRDMVASIVRNPDAQLCLSQLKDRDQYTAQHSVNVCVLTIAFGRHMGLPENELNLLGTGALLHDIGKLRTPLDILNKPDRLTPQELEIIKSHPEEGRRILAQSRKMAGPVLDIAHSHHERMEGHGYPRRLHGERISDWGRMVAIVDVYDAITSDRAYHHGLGAGDALSRMYEWKGRDFDSDLLDEFIRCIGVYPVGSLVEMTSGEVGIVLSAQEKRKLRPKVMLIRDERGNPYQPSRICDLTLMGSGGSGAYGIKKVLGPGARGIDVRDYLLEVAAARGA
ncbi:MAG: HD-GYP domain-containing protein [Gammaproteobacteria bacterium]|nr:HD-GYP domain-containing protein [Gammaproteobacteria bacterium]